MASGTVFFAAFLHNALIVTYGLVLHSNDTIASMARSFDPSLEDRRASMASIMRNMTTDSAMQILAKDQQAPAALIASVRTVLSSSKTRGLSRDGKHLRSSAGEPDIIETMELLNTMIHKSQQKYDLEQAKCANYYAKQCAAMEASRGEIAATNGAGASCKAKTLSAQGELTRESKELPTLKQTLAEQTRQCQNQVNSTKTQLATLLGDITAMTSILKQTQCNKALLQKKSLNLLHCQTACAAKPYVSFQDSGMREKLDALESPRLHEALQETFAEFLTSKPLGQGSELVQEEPQLPKEPVINETKVAREPAPRTDLPADPCKDPNFGAPSAGKRASKCTVTDNPNCDAMNSRFLFIQAGMLDERDNVREELVELEEKCQKQEKTLQDEIEQAETVLKDEQTKLADASSCESTASEKGRLATAQYNEQVDDLKSEQAKCQDNFQHLLNEQCGLKKIRGEVAGLADIGGRIQDCEVGTWQPGQCNVSCGGGFMELTRTVEMPADGGTECLPLKQGRSCNDSPCPVDCKVAEWGEWSSCTAQCGGGVAQRQRDVETQVKFGGKPCGETTEAKSCNVQACDKACELSEWTAWTSCSKQCDAGTQKRTRFVKVKATGEGKCATETSPDRLQYKPCNVVACQKVERTGKPTLQCKSNVDVILVLDGSTTVGEAGWSKTLEAAKLIMSAFQEKADDRFAVLTYSGPKYWDGVAKCIGEAPGPVDAHKDCKITWAQKFTNDISKATSAIQGLPWPQGGALTSMALNSAALELETARKDAKAAVVVITDGRPLSFRKTGLASELIKKKARLMWVPVSKLAPLKSFKTWASSRWQENVVSVDSYDKLATPETIDHILTDMCRQVDGGYPPPAAPTEEREARGYDWKRPDSSSTGRRRRRSYSRSSSKSKSSSDDRRRRRRSFSRFR